jgi:hypothetical protein
MVPSARGSGSLIFSISALSAADAALLKDTSTNIARHNLVKHLTDIVQEILL